jgi:hypothetical protein
MDLAANTSSRADVAFIILNIILMFFIKTIRKTIIHVNISLETIRAFLHHNLNLNTTGLKYTISTKIIIYSHLDSTISYILTRCYI